VPGVVALLVLAAAVAVGTAWLLLDAGQGLPL
jgi:hypothetical protein